MIEHKPSFIHREEPPPPADVNLKLSDISSCVDVCPLFEKNRGQPPTMRCGHRLATCFGFIDFSNLEDSFPKDCPLKKEK